jgi:hypothetical protein
VAQFVNRLNKAGHVKRGKIGKRLS